QRGTRPRPRPRVPKERSAALRSPSRDRRARRRRPQAFSRAGASRARSAPALLARLLVRLGFQRKSPRGIQRLRGEMAGEANPRFDKALSFAAEAHGAAKQE